MTDHNDEDSNESGTEGLFGAARKALGMQRRHPNDGDSRRSAMAVRERQGPTAVELASIAAGPSVRMDAQALVVMIATYGEGDKRGKFAFSSTELAGAPAGSNKDTGASWGAVEGSLKGPDGKSISGPRLRDAVAFLVGKGWAKTTDDGEFASGTDFHEVSLTATGRDLVHGAASAALAGGGNVPGGDLFGGFPDFGAPAASVAPVLSDRDAFANMLAKAKVAFATDPNDEGTDITLSVKRKPLVVFTFDVNGALEGVGEP